MAHQVCYNQTYSFNHESLEEAKLENLKHNWDGTSLKQELKEI